MKNAISWLLALMITFSIVIFQFIMSKTHPLSTEVNTGKQHLHFDLLRSYSGKTDCPMILKVEDITVSGYILYRNYPTADSMIRINLHREGDNLIAYLPNQLPSKKLEYRIFLERAGNVILVNSGKPIIIKFLGVVPFYILLFHTIFIFLSVLFSNSTGIFAVVGNKSYKWMIYLTILALMSVVFLLQPLTHKYALGQSLTGFPFSFELSDNKILITLVIWLVTMFFNLRKAQPRLVVLAAFTSMIVLSIPHGFPGSEPNPINMKIIQRNFLSLLQLF